MSASKSVITSLLLAALMNLAPVHAADKKAADASKEQLRRLQQSQRQLEQEKGQLAQEKAAAEAELGNIKKKADGEARRAASLSHEVGAMRAARDGIAAKLAAAEAELRKTLELKQAAELENKRLQGLLAEETKSLAACGERSKALRQLGGEVIDLYEKKSCLESALQSESLTGLKRIAVENAAEEMREKLEGK